MRLKEGFGGAARESIPACKVKATQKTKDAQMLLPLHSAPVLAERKKPGRGRGGKEVAKRWQRLMARMRMVGLHPEGSTTWSKED